MNKNYEKQAEKILSLDSIWKNKSNKSEQFKELSIKIMVNTLKYIDSLKNYNENIFNL